MWEGNILMQRVERERERERDEFIGNSCVTCVGGEVWEENSVMQKCLCVCFTFRDNSN